MKWNRILAASFLVIWITMMPCILFPGMMPISQVNAFILSLISFPLFAFYVSRFDEKAIIPQNARSSLEMNGVMLFLGRLFIAGFMILLICAAILMGIINTGDAANDISTYAYYSLVFGITLIALSSLGRREISMKGRKVERSTLDLGLSTSYRFLKTKLNTINRGGSNIIPIIPQKNVTMMHELLNSIEELRSRLDAMQHIYDQQLEELRKRLARIEEKLDLKSD